MEFVFDIVYFYGTFLNQVRVLDLALHMEERHRRDVLFSGAYVFILEKLIIFFIVTVSCVSLLKKMTHWLLEKGSVCD